MREAQKPLVERMEAADRVRITAPGTDLEFSIKDIPVIPCSGRTEHPRRRGLHRAGARRASTASIRFNTPSRYQGTVFSDIRFTFKDGKIVDASSDTERINAAARLRRGRDATAASGRSAPTTACGTRCSTRCSTRRSAARSTSRPGNAYEEADNGNRSRIHWDLVLIQREDYGGGEVWFDGELVRKDGRFVPDDLRGLNEGL